MLLCCCSLIVSVFCFFSVSFFFSSVSLLCSLSALTKHPAFLIVTWAKGWGFLFCMRACFLSNLGESIAMPMLKEEEQKQTKKRREKGPSAHSCTRQSLYGLVFFFFFFLFPPSRQRNHLSMMPTHSCSFNRCEIRALIHGRSRHVVPQTQKEEKRRNQERKEEKQRFSFSRRERERERDW
ncbi:hypothetical protein LX36DRAFT_130645 [Colletotrichum falcatum]|nr:hypothetical protein LX36DRAFT_130645 [Colletotrichum falcatum]